MLPNFLIIGAQKAATSWLALCLSEHPDLFMPSDKEIFFFDQHFHKGINWYAYHFRFRQKEIAVGEATPNYLNHPKVPYRIRETLGDNIKFIVSLRHPVDRAYSAFWHYVRRGFFPIDADFQQYFLEDGRFELRSRGYYFVQLQRYLSLFPSEKILILIQEQFKNRPETAISQCFSFLQINTAFTPSLLHNNVNRGGSVLLFHRHVYKVREKIKLLPSSWQRVLVSVGNNTINLLPTAHEPEKLDASLRQNLFETYYAEDTDRLADLIGLDLSTWQTSSVAG